MISELVEYAKSFVGKPYVFGTAPGGGDDPIGGFDCSGLGSELLRAAGVMPWNYRKNAQGIYLDLEGKSTHGVFQPGAFSFYGKDFKSIGHIGFLITPYLMIEAGGGDSTTNTPEEQSRQNAFVRMRPVKYRKDFLITLRPVYPGTL